MVPQSGAFADASLFLAPRVMQWLTEPAPDTQAHNRQGRGPAPPPSRSLLSRILTPFPSLTPVAPSPVRQTVLPFRGRRLETAEDTAPHHAARAPGLRLPTGCSGWELSLVRGVPGAFILVTEISPDALSQEPNAAPLL